MKLLIIDNYDSFTYNLVQLFKEAGCKDIEVFKNDEIKVEAINKYDKIVFSPGPGLPIKNSAMEQILENYSATKSILGVCLGHQAIGVYFGGKLMNYETPVHGIASNLIITDKNEVLFKEMHGIITIGRYHSWVLETMSLPESLKITSVIDDGSIMSLAHKNFDIRGVQFHPESYITREGLKIVKNWLKS